MIDIEKLDAFFDLSLTVFGTTPGCFLFDRRVLMPFSMLPDAVARETGHEVSDADLHRYLDAGWFPRYEGAGENENELGVPVYVISRIGMFRDLQRTDGYTDAELAEVAEAEDGLVENVLTVEEFAYEDDDLAEVIRRIEEDLLDVRLELERPGHPKKFDGKEWIHAPRSPAEQKELEDRHRKIERTLARYRALRWEDLSEERRLEISRMAFRIRSFNDVIRLLMVDRDRARVRAGYSGGMRLDAEAHWFDHYDPGPVNWARTLYSEWFMKNPERRIRVPGVVIEGTTVTLTRSPSPAEYDRVWKEYDLEECLRLMAKIREERVCPNCMTPLGDADPRRVYCSENCRQSAKQKRYRERNPRAAARAQWNYWNSIPEPAEVKDVGQRR